VNGAAQYGTQPSGPLNRLVLLGASNLTVSLRTVIELMQDRCGGPSDVLVAAGHGRSYGRNSQVLIRGLPGIISSGLWSHLDSASKLPTSALLTDIGNDIAYGYAPGQILEWVSWCVHRLQRQAAQIVMTNVPVASIESLSETHYRLIRRIFFPFSQLSRREAVNRTRLVHRGLRDIASDYNFQLFEQEPIWFGPDAIHIRYRKRKALFRRIVERLPASSGVRDSMVEEALRKATWSKPPQFAYRTVLGQERHCQQPSGQLTDGTAVYMY
jgi:hypothetical protein